MLDVRARPSCRRVAGLAATVLLAASAIGCRAARVGSPSAAEPAVAEKTPTTEVGNPFANVEQYRAPNSLAETAQQRALTDNPEEAALLSKIASQPQATWFGGWNQNVGITIKNYVNAAERDGKLAVMVSYNVPDRDCGQYSAGGATNDDSYLDWVREVASGIGDRRAVVILEPDAVPLLTQCLSGPDQEKRLALIRQAVEILNAGARTAVYVDAGHSAWVEAKEMARRLKAAGVELARGFALNTSNYQTDESLIAYGKQVMAELGLQTHFIIDSSRNGNGPATGEESWCNPEGRALGRPPGSDTGDPAIDAFVWTKRPGESDGTCSGGPPAGQWFHERAVELARNAAW